VLLPPAEQPAFLLQHCADDPELRERLRSLLQKDAEPPSTLFEGSAADGSAPRRIGHFTLLEVLGEGGMGTVYLARQDEPRRLVALKTVRVCTGSPEVAARLVTEFRGSKVSCAFPSCARS
jgi:non-specific serine/threonine protein kinase/serine/threonine-protein kinase